MQLRMECANCGMPRAEWKGNGGQGHTQNGQMYCCKGCRDNDCTCVQREAVAAARDYGQSS